MRDKRPFLNILFHQMKMMKAKFEYLFFSCARDFLIPSVSWNCHWFLQSDISYQPILSPSDFKVCWIKVKIRIYRELYPYFLSSLQSHRRNYSSFNHNYSQSFSGGVLPVLILTCGLPWRYYKLCNTWMWLQTPTLSCFLKSHYLMPTGNKEIDKPINQ